MSKDVAARGPRLKPRTRGAMNRRRFVSTFGAGLGLVFFPRVPRWRADEVFVERWSWAMGQPVHVMVFAGSEQEGLDACAAALAELRRVERRLTLFDAASDLCELNRCAGRKRMRVDRDLQAVLLQADVFKPATGGAFDVAVEPLMRVWGFHRHRATAPTATELEEAREAVRAGMVELDGDVARLPSAHTQLDFAGAAPRARAPARVHRRERRHGGHRYAAGRARLAGRDRRPRSNGGRSTPHRGGDPAAGRRARDRGEHRVHRALRVARSGPRDGSRDGVASPRAEAGHRRHEERRSGGRAVDRDAGDRAQTGRRAKSILRPAYVIPGLAPGVSRDSEAN